MQKEYKRRSYTIFISDIHLYMLGPGLYFFIIKKCAIDFDQGIAGDFAVAVFCWVFSCGKSPGRTIPSSKDILLKQKSC